MSYHALYRRYRPTRFKDIVGQEHITSILKNQIRTGRIAHAYLFSGSRGTGKTTTARILAHAINCISPEDGECCGECEACKLNAADCIDIIEMDAASNSKVDEMRALLDKAELAPIYLRYKVYIIDEAHMLSKSANNALLKTLEEPPEHVVFILATTEPQALPATILSRCQRFDFKRLSASAMAGYLRKVLADAGAAIDDDGLMCIARAADGGMRDCLSIADQCLSYCGSNITHSDVLAVLGSMDSGFMFNFADRVIESDASGALEMINEVVSGGRDIGVFVQDLASHFRALLLTKVCGNCSDILDCTSDDMQLYMGQAQRAARTRIERALSELMDLQQNLKWVMMPRILLESAIVKICRPDEQQGMIELKDRIETIENMLRDGRVVVSDANDAMQTRTASGENEISNEPLEASKRTPNNREAAEQDAGRVIDEIPQATVEADNLYKSFMAAIMKSDIMLGIQLQMAKAHWCSDDCLYICFDKSKRSNYNYVSSSENMLKLRQAAALSIEPFSVRVVQRDGGSNDDADTLNQLFGIEITEE